MRSFILFVTADGCSRMVPTGANWNVPPMLHLPLSYPAKIMDWVNDPENPPETIIKTRSYRLETEEVLDDRVTHIFTYREIE